MNKYYLSADLEGIAGVTSLLQCYPKTDRSEYNAAVRQMALEINTVADVILAVDADAWILVNDAHSTMTNLTPDMLRPELHLLSGKPKRCAMMTGLDSSFTAAILLGYHAKAGTQCGVLNHSYHGKLFDIRVNGQSLGESGINTLYAWLQFGVPVILGSGDRAFCDEIRSLSPHIATVETKVGLSTTAAICHAPSQVLADYEKKTHDALTRLNAEDRDRFSPNLEGFDSPFTLEITFTNTLSCDVVATSPLFERVDGTTVAYQTPLFDTLYRALQSTYAMLGYMAYME